MSQNTVNTGTTANDGTGDTLRTAFTKVNDDITEIFFNVANNTSNIANLVVAVNNADGQLLALGSMAFDTANAAYAFSNAQYTAMNAAFTMANTVNSLFYGAVVNSAAAFQMANSTVVKTNAVYSLTNASFNVANAAFNLANTLDPTASGARQVASFDKANLAFQLAGEAFDMANAVYSTVAGCVSNTTSAYNFANGVSVNVESAYRVANAAFGVANSGYNTSNSIYYKTNSCYSVTNSAYNTANSKINTANGTSTGTFTSQGDVYVYGNTTLSSGLHSFNLTGGTISKNINIIANIPTYKGTINFYDSSQSTIYSSLTANSVGLYIDSSLMVTGDITAFYGTTSDQRFKTNLEKICNPLEKYPK
jgi:hypothetical protein